MRPVRSAFDRRFVRLLFCPARQPERCRLYAPVASAPRPTSSPSHSGSASPSRRPERPAAGVTRFINNFVTDSIVGIGWDGQPVDRLVGRGRRLWSDDGAEASTSLRRTSSSMTARRSTARISGSGWKSILKEPQAPGTNVSYQSVTGVELDPETDGSAHHQALAPRGVPPDRSRQLDVPASDRRRTSAPVPTRS